VDTWNQAVAIGVEAKKLKIVKIMKMHGCRASEKGKGSHTLWELRGEDGKVLATTILPDYRDISEKLWTKIEKDLAEHLGERWLRNALS